MTQPPIETVIRSVLARDLDIEASRLTRDARLGDDLCIDSLAAVELVMAVEDETGVTLPDNVIRAGMTYGDLVDAVVHTASTSQN